MKSFGAQDIPVRAVSDLRAGEQQVWRLTQVNDLRAGGQQQ
jgi:hypothetical protein